MDTVLEARDLTKHYADFSLRGVSLVVRRGAVSGVFGPNAAGKSTLLRMLAGQTPVPSGTLCVLGETFANAERDLKNRVGFVPQEPAFYQDKTVEWHARFAARYFAHWDGAGFYRLLEKFRVNPLKPVKQLSGGGKKLLSLAMALSHGAELLILDEPTAGLDIVHRRWLLERLRELAAGSETTVVVASHVTDGLDEIAEDITFLCDGRVVLHADSDDLMTRWKWVLYKEGTLGRGVEDGFVTLRRQPFGNRGLTDDLPALREDLATALASGEARLDHASLEDILLSLVKEG